MKSTKKSGPFQGWAFAATQSVPYPIARPNEVICFTVVAVVSFVIAALNVRRRIGRGTRRNARNFQS
jgi:hypothetical protein